VSSTTRRIDVRIENVLDMDHGETRVFHYERGGRREQGFLLCLGEEFVAFSNTCPHWNVNLDLGDERFFDERIQAIVCRNHGAIFEPRGGQCTAGPCRGAYLERFEVEIDGKDARAIVIETRLIFP
jgi:nitrite reductase/ring-hydroxylating ferredoxin subunit